MASATEEILEGTVTVLFTDVQGSTEMRNQRGDEAAGSILRVHEDLVRKQIEAHSGREVKALGDGFMVAFGSARKAVLCAVAIQKAVHEHNRTNPGHACHVRIGLNSGEVSQEDGDLFGAAVNAAARVAAKAKGDQILVTGVVRQLAGRVPAAGFVDRGRFRLKGFDERWQLFEVTWEASPEPDSHRHLDQPPALVGRDAERTELIHALDHAAEGRGGLVMLGGEPGVGKTRLAEEVLAEARRRGYLAVTGRCYESEGAAPYAPFVELVEDAGRQVDDDRFRRALGDGGGEVAKLVPGLRRRFPDLPAGLELPPEQERRYLYNSIHDFVGRASGVQPVCVLLDDLHWADEGSLLLLDRVAEDLGDSRVLVIGTYRDVELDLGRPLARTLDGLVRRHLARRLSVKRLTQPYVAMMLAAMGGADPPEALVGSIYAETEGNPFFVEEIFKHLCESGVVFEPGGAWRSDLDVSDVDVPESVRLVIGRRLERLGEHALKALSAAAVIGRSFDFRLLAAMVDDLDDDALLDALDEAERPGLVSSAAKGDDVGYEFAHELIRQTLLTGMSALRRQRLHVRVAEAMEVVYGESSSDHAADLARHLIEAGAAADRAKAVHYLDLAGQQALTSAAFEDALRTYENALAMVPPGDLELEATVKHGLGQAYRSLGRWEDCRLAWGDAIDIYEQLGRGDLVGRLCVDQALQLTWALRYEEALLVAGRGLAAVGEEPSVDRVILLGLSGVTLSIAGNHRAGDEMTAETLELARQLSDQASLGFALGVRAVHHWAYMELRQSVESGLQSLRLASAAGELWRQADVGTFPAMSLRFLGRDDEAAAVLDEIEPIAERIGHRQSSALMFRIRNFMVARGPGFPEQQLRWVEADHENTRGFMGSWDADSQALTAIALFWAGHWEEALERAVQASQTTVPWIWNPSYFAVVMVIAAHLGETDMVLSAFADLERERPEPGRPATLGVWGGYLNAVEALLLVGQKEQAAAIRPILGRIVEAGAWSLTYTERLVQTAAALAACADGDWTAAEEHLATAEGQARLHRDQIQGADIKRFRAMMLVDRAQPGDRDAARDLLRQASAAYGEIGMPRHVVMARALLEKT